MKTSYLICGILLLWIAQACELTSDEPVAFSKCSTFVESNGKEVLRHETIYDEQERLIAELFYTSNEKVYRRIAYGYEKDNLIYIRTYQNETLTDEVQQSFIGNRLMYKNVYASGKPVSSTAYSYYPTGVIKRTVEDYLFEPEKPVTTVSNFDEEGRKMTVFRQIYEDKSRKVISRYEMDQYIRTKNPDNDLPARETTLIYFGYYEAADTVSDLIHRYEDTLITATIYVQKGMYDLPDSAHYYYNDQRQLVCQVNYFTTKSSEQPLKADTLEFQYDSMKRLILENDLARGVKTIYRYESSQ